MVAAVNAVPGYSMNGKPEPREREARDESRPSADEHEDQDDAIATFWHWFALAALLFAWIAEATMCADRGF
jgi:hypothetical protein